MSKLLSLEILPAALFGAVLLLSCSPRPSGPQPEGVGEAESLRIRIVELTRKEQLLAAEKSLARASSPYLIVDLGRSSIELKARGRSLRTFSIRRAQRNGSPLQANQVWTTVDKRPLQEAARIRIAPGAGEDAAAEAARQAKWGPDSMPADFDLVCSGKRKLEIRSLPSDDGRFFLVRLAAALYRGLSGGLRRAFAGRNAGVEDSLEIRLADKDSKLLFWSLPSESRILIRTGDLETVRSR